MKLATTTGDFSPYAQTQTDCMRWIREAGFRYMDYNFGMDWSRKNGVFGPDRGAFLTDVLREADRLGASFVQAHAPMGKPIERGAYHDEFVEMNLRCIEACAVLGIDRLVIHSGYEMGISKEECFARNRDFFLELLPAAEGAGVNILVENFNKMCVDGMYWIDNAPDLRALIDLVDHPFFHAVWDAGHANMQDMPQHEALRIVGSHVMALHVQDNMGDTDAHMAPFFGTLNLDSLMRGLSDIGYRGYFTFEAGNFFLPGNRRRPFEGENRLLNPPLDLRIRAEALLYDIGRTVLGAYGCYEE